MTKTVSADSISPKAILGKDGFLFLGGPDANSISSFFSGEDEISTAAINTHVFNFQALERAGLPYSVVIIPEAHVIYSDLLPDDMRIVESRPVKRLLALPGCRFIYPIDELRRLRAAGVPVYTGRDSHYTEFAAVEAYKAVRVAQGIEHPFAPSYEPSVNRESGDLTTGDLAAVIRREETLQNEIPRSHFKSVYTNRVRNNGGLAIFSNPDAPLGRALCFGTSFSRHLIAAYCTDFREVVFCYGTAIDDGLLRMVQPERIFVEMPERFAHMPHIAVSGSVSCGHVLRSEPRKRSELGTPPADLESIQALAHNMDVLATSGTAIPKAFTVMGPAAMSRLRFTRTAKLSENERNQVRILMGGHFRRGGLVNQISRLFDEAPLNEAIDIIPETEMGSLAKLRGLCRQKRFGEAAQVLERYEAMFGQSKQSQYFTKLLLPRA